MKLQGFFISSKITEIFILWRVANNSTESFNARLKAFRTSQRCVVDIRIFLVRLTKIYA